MHAQLSLNYLIFLLGIPNENSCSYDWLEKHLMNTTHLVMFTSWLKRSVYHQDIISEKGIKVALSRSDCHNYPQAFWEGPQSTISLSRLEKNAFHSGYVEENIPEGGQTSFNFRPKELQLVVIGSRSMDSSWFHSNTDIPMYSMNMLPLYIIASQMTSFSFNLMTYITHHPLCPIVYYFLWSFDFSFSHTSVCLADRNAFLHFIKHHLQSLAADEVFTLIGISIMKISEIEITSHGL